MPAGHRGMPWIIGENLGVFSAVAVFALERGLSSFIYFGFLMSFFLALGCVRKSMQVRREMAARADSEAQARWRPGMTR